MAKVEVISSCIIRIAGSNANPISRLDLTPWDLQLLPLDPIQKGLLFHISPQSQQTLIDHLKSSLSRTLEFFPPLAGRLASTAHDDGTISFFLNCNNAGAEFVHAVAVETSVSDISEPKRIPKILASFFPQNSLPNWDGVSKPLLAVQVTELVDGVFIACTANHVVVDGISFWHFVNSWSEISRGFATISKTPVFKRDVDVKRPFRLPRLEQDPSRCSAPPLLLERVFHFSKQTLSKLKARANSEAATDKISSLQALSAHLWRSVWRCRFLDDQRCQEAPFVMLVGGRARIPLPEGYFGNAVMGAKTTVSAAELVHEGIGHAAMKINEMVAQQTREAIIKQMEDWAVNPTFLRKGGLAVVITSSPRHNVYGNDFGWGKPLAVRSGPGQKSDGKMTLFPAAETGGIDVEVCLAPETLRAIEGDAEFIEAFTV
ncbi:uncharacterized acetyltransferase At3g50280-like [Salvia miltiorrhiza]|uniref:uncharacterized acetyltransferase At3g50280-like n=1 Tax=Salvia miltiorrhiza TaxID=226208 RepID=UPI0025AC4B6B|nr:uncharacterized acetyltransferase At3g50280-like [Salvia miltiorrhiza]